jgi:hypothetical protein
MRVHRYCRRHFWKFQQAFAQKVYRDSTPKVLHGPFAGMKYFNRGVGPADADVDRFVRVRAAGHRRRNCPPIICHRDRRRCAEGYYAGPLAWRMPMTRVHAFDLDFFARRQVRALAKLNRVGDRLVVEAESTHEVLEARINPQGTLLVVDIERGAELQLLIPDACPRLHTCDILVECHAVGEDRPAAVAEAIAGRFAATHHGTTVWAADRCVGDWTTRHERLNQLELQSLSIGLQELRSEPQVGLWMTSLGGANDSPPD